MQKPLAVKTVLLKLLWLLPAVAFFALSRYAIRYPAATEVVYAQKIYPFLMQPLSAVTGLLPFSLGEVLLYALILFGVFFVFSTLRAVIRAKGQWWQALARRVLFLLAFASVCYSLFVGLFGLCYARMPLSDTLGLNVSPAAEQELYQTAKALVDKANALRSEIQTKEGGLDSSYARRVAVLNAVPSYYKAAAEKTGLLLLGGDYGPVKPVAFSTGLSYANLEGIYCPFTGEANVNIQMPMLDFAASALHEAAHQRGFAREDEANFLAYYVGSMADDIDVQYSATVLAMTYAMNSLYSANADDYATLYASIGSAVKAEINASANYWKQYEGSVSEASARVNDNYLKSNNQSDGIESYGRMVDLLIGLHRQGGI